MPHDIATTIQQLRSLHATGLLDDEELEQKLARLRTKFDAVAVEAALASLAPPDAPQAQINLAGAQMGDVSTGDVAAGNQVTLKDKAQAEVVIGGNLYGHIFIGGQRTQSATALLHAYLQRVIAACDALPLQAFRDKQDLHDQVALSLEQVYTELATTAEPVLRERFADEALRQLDVAAFWEAHVGAAILPWKRRLTLIRPLLADERQSGPDDLHVGKQDVSAERSTRVNGRIETLEEIGLERLKALPTQVLWLQFTGPQLVTEALATDQRLVLLGEPGSGKSTALRFLALTLARAATDATLPLAERLPGWPATDGGERLLPVLLPLLPFAKYLAEGKRAAAGSADLWNYIASQLGERGRYQGLSEAVHSELEAGRVLLLLDGLDEVAGEASRHLVVHAVAAFAREYRTCRMVVSCRVRAYEGVQNTAWQLPGWPSVTLADWMPSQMQHFVAAWYAAVGGVPPDERERRRAELQEALARRADLQRLGGRPLLLTIMALVHYNDSKLPEERAALYSRCVDILLARWELGRTLSGYASAYGTLMDYIGMPDADVKTLRPLLQQAAFLAHCAATPESLGSLTRNDLHMLVADALKDRHRNPHDAARRFLEYTDTRAGLLQARTAGDEYVFPHQTFQEYLAGLELVKGAGFVDQIMNLRQEDRWRVPIFLGLGHAVNESLYAIPYQLLNRLRCETERTDEQRQRDLIFAAEIAEDVGWTRLLRGGAEFGQLRIDLAQDLVAVVEGTLLPAAERVRAGELLGNLDDPRPGVCILPPAMVAFIGGPFQIGITKAELTQIVEQERHGWRAREAESWYSDALNPTTIPIKPFELARYPVTNAQYAIFMREGGYDPAQIWWSEPARLWLRRDDQATEGLAPWLQRSHKHQPEFWDDPRFGKARLNHPVVGISWYEATAFCIWLKHHLNDGYVYCLPSEAEWEYAARGLERRTYPWGKEPLDGERANFDNLYSGTTAVGCFSAGSTTPGSTRLGVTSQGLLDLAGNVWEWTCSEFRDYPYDANDGRETPADPARKSFTLRGGSWPLDSVSLRTAFRGHDAPDDRNPTLGFRLARRRGSDE